MSPHAVNSLVSDLVSMAKAVEELPLVQEALEKSQHEARDYADLVHNREAEIASLRKQITDMTDRIHTAEVARDDAELRFLELEERFGKVAAAITMASKAMDVADAMAKPEPVKSVAEGEAHRQPEASQPAPIFSGGFGLSDATQGQSATDPTVSATLAETGNSAPSQSAESTASVSQPSTIGTSPSSEQLAPSSEGVSVPTDPSPGVTAPTLSEVSAPTADVHGDVSSPDPSKPYLGKLYRDVPGYVSFAAWINGGGRESDYYIR